MSLNYDITKISKDIAFDEEGMSGLTQMMILCTIPAKMGWIEARNVDKFYQRINMIQRNLYPLLVKGEEPYYITRQDVVNHIGLKTNVSTESDRAWIKWFKDRLYDEAVRKTADKTEKGE